MQAVLTVTIKDPEGKATNKRLLFDTEKSQKVCDVINAFGYAVQTIWLSPAGWLFLEDNNRGGLSVADQTKAKDYIGEHYPDKFIEFFGEIEEA